MILVTTERGQLETIEMHSLNGLRMDGITEVFLNGRQLDLKESLKVRRHSPTGFNWGYGGSGPAQLALAVCLEIMPKEDALKFYQEFKRRVIADIKEDDFSIIFEFKTKE